DLVLVPLVGLLLDVDRHARVELLVLRRHLLEVRLEVPRVARDDADGALVLDLGEVDVRAAGRAPATTVAAPCEREGGDGPRRERLGDVLHVSSSLAPVMLPYAVVQVRCLCRSWVERS